MKRILALLILFLFMFLLTFPIVTNSKSINVKSINNITTLENVKLEAGVSKIIFSDIEIKEWNSGWANENIFIHITPSISSETIIAEQKFNQKIYYIKHDEEWAYSQTTVGNETIIGYISLYDIAESECLYIEHELPKNTGFKSYMPYTAITDKNSKQYKLQQLAESNKQGIRVVNGYRYCVAIGTAFNGEIGDYFDLVLDNGEVIPCIVGDIKADKHTKADNITTASNGCVSEFIVDNKKLNKDTKRDGDISSCFEKWNSPVSKIKIYEKNIFDEEKKEQ